MPSPIGHAMAGLIVALAGEKTSPGEANPRTVRWTLVVSCAVLAALPDIDWVYPPLHRGPTHSIGAVAIVALATIAVTRYSTGRVRWLDVLLCSLAYASHIVMDWLGQDPTPMPGVKAFWPLSDRLFMSGLDLFRSTERFEPLSPPQLGHNIRTLAQEIVTLGPFLFWLLWRRRKTTSR